MGEELRARVEDAVVLERLLMIKDKIVLASDGGIVVRGDLFVNRQAGKIARVLEDAGLGKHALGVLMQPGGCR